MGLAEQTAVLTSTGVIPIELADNRALQTSAGFASQAKWFVQTWLRSRNLLIKCSKHRSAELVLLKL